MSASQSQSLASSSAEAYDRLSQLRPSFQQTMLRIKNPTASLKFYTEVMGMTHVDTYDFNDMGFSLYFLQSFDEGAKPALEPGSVDAHKHLWSTQGTVLELTHNHEDSGEVYHAGNEEGDGFGHIAFNCDDVYASCKRLEEQGVTFKKKPDEGRMKGLAFAYDPDGYWVEIVPRSDKSEIKQEFNLSQTMMRIKDPARSLPFYRDGMGMTLVRESHYPEANFSNYFLATLPPGTPPPTHDPQDRDASKGYVGALHGPVLELTHNHGTENDPDFKHKNGNEQGKRGFGHIGFLVDDVDEACAAIEAAGSELAKRPEGGKMQGLAFALDPDGYMVEIVKRGGYGDAFQPYK
ncbi:lactoylglutathione lyase [Pycnococcus provasolii]